MPSTVNRIKRAVNIDQRNLSNAELVSIGDSTARVRLPDGREMTAYLPEDLSGAAGDLVQVEITGRLAEVRSAARLQRSSGKRTIIVNAEYYLQSYVLDGDGNYLTDGDGHTIYGFGE